MAYSSWRPGVVLRFTYTHRVIDEHSGDRYKEILVLNPSWRGKVHGIDMKRLTAAQREVLLAIFDPQWKTKPHRLPMVNDVLRRMDPVEDVKNPQSFYQKFVWIFLHNVDAYRQYWPGRMSGVTVVRQTQVRGGTYNPKPLFKKIKIDAQKRDVEQRAAQRELTPDEKRARLAAIEKAAIKLLGRDKGKALVSAPTRGATKPQPARKPTPSQPAKGSAAKNAEERLAMLKAAAERLKGKK